MGRLPDPGMTSEAKRTALLVTTMHARPSARRFAVYSAAVGMLLAGGLFLALRVGESGAASQSECGSPGNFSPYVDVAGCISLPMNYRTEFVHLGSWFIPGESGMTDGREPEGHTVFSQKSTVDAFKRTGQFPDGAVLVKSVRAFDNATLTTGNAHWAAQQKVWFVMIRDSQNRFPDNPLWDEGWGWALFEAKDPGVNVATSFRTDCYVCHLPRQNTDWVYVEGYPTLK